jgi:hypothetical protein
MIVSDLRALGVLSGRPKPLVAFIQQTPESDHELFVLEIILVVGGIALPSARSQLRICRPQLLRITLDALIK